MEKRRERKTWMAWLMVRWKTALVFLGVGGIFFLMSWLYGLRPDGAGYAFLLASCLICGYLAQDYREFRKRHRQLGDILKQETAITDRLPETGDLLEQDYQSLLLKLEGQLEETQSLTENRQRDMVEYYTMWAHQIKTPIAGMRLLLQQPELPDKRELEMELLRIEQYVQMVLSYLRLQDLHSDLRIRSYDLDRMIHQAVKRFSRFFISKKLHLEYEPVNTKVLTDEKWLALVLEQLLSNAVKYTPDQGTIRIYMEKPKTLVIKDSGIGIREEDLPRVFERGFTGFNGRKQKKATGLGLYLCKEICGKLSHGLSLVSKPGEGTAVRLELDSVDLHL